MDISLNKRKLTGPFLELFKENQNFPRVNLAERALNSDGHLLNILRVDQGWAWCVIYPVQLTMSNSLCLCLSVSVSLSVCLSQSLSLCMSLSLCLSLSLSITKTSNEQYLQHIQWRRWTSLNTESLEFRCTSFKKRMIGIQCCLSANIVCLQKSFYLSEHPIFVRGVSHMVAPPFRMVPNHYISEIMFVLVGPVVSRKSNL